MAAVVLPIARCSEIASIIAQTFGAAKTWISSTGRTRRFTAKSAEYDCVLSTQVLEHVEDPQGYLEECHRVLTPGGHLVLTTHGLFEDHACPYDYWRWTADGLKRLVGGVGLEVSSSKKMTTGPRCILYLAEREVWAVAILGGPDCTGSYCRSVHGRCNVWGAAVCMKQATKASRIVASSILKRRAMKSMF